MSPRNTLNTRNALTALCALGLVLSSMLSWHWFTGGAMLGCGGGSPCDDVLSSRWSTIAGVLPVSGLAASAYLAMLVCSLSIGPATEGAVRRLAWGALLVLAGAAAGSAVWFTVVQKAFLGTFCPYCMATHVTGVLVAAIVLWRAPLDRDAEGVDLPLTAAPGGGRRGEGAAPSAPGSRADARRGIRRWPAFALALAGVGLAAALAIAQWRLVPAARSRGGEAPGPLAAVDAHAVPLIGSPDARYVVTLLFDYKCPHCQQLHVMLDAAVRQYGGQLAFALSPAPLNRACNPYVPRDVEEFKDSCALTRVALAVWVADRAAFSGFDRWMYAYESGDRWRPRTLEAARAKAIELVGRARFDAAANDPWIDRYLQRSVQLYGATLQHGAGGVPKLVFGSRWVTPQPNTPADLVAILHASLGVPSP